MRLSFLGQFYETNAPPVTGSETAETIVFLGRRYQMKQFDSAKRSPHGEELTFLGRRYQR